MAISFNSIPSDTRVPLFYAEMDNSAANTARDSGASLLIGHASNDASIAVNSLVLVSSVDYARQICGAGSQLARMVGAYRRPIHLANCMSLPYLNPQARQQPSL